MKLSPSLLISGRLARNDHVKRSVSSLFCEVGVPPAETREKCELELDCLHQDQDTQLGTLPRGVLRDLTSYLAARQNPQDLADEGERWTSCVDFSAPCCHLTQISVRLATLPSSVLDWLML